MGRVEEDPCIDAPQLKHVCPLDDQRLKRSEVEVKLFQWYAMFCYWQYIVLSLSVTLFRTHDATTAGFR